MPKSTITINDTFVFHFPKAEWNSEKAEDIEIPRHIFQFFLENCKRQSLFTMDYHEKSFETLQNENYLPNLDSDPFFILNATIIFDFGPDKIGGVSYTVGPVINSDFIDISNVNVIDEDDSNIYVSMSIKGEWSWDFRTPEWNKIANKITSNNIPVESSRVKLRINFNTNRYILRAFPEFDRKKVDPMHQTLDHLPFVLSSWPEISCTVHSVPPKTNAQKNVKFWTMLNEKKVSLGGKNLAVYNIPR